MTENKFTEVELKFKLNNPDESMQKIMGLTNSTYIKHFQKDTYYTPAHKDFTKAQPIKEWLRIRSSNKGNSLNYKNWHYERNDKAVSADEFETFIHNKETTEKILQNLDFKKLIIVDKTRHIWNYKNTEIAIDDVKGLGWYIELEAKGDFQSIEEAKTHLYNIIKELAISPGPQIFKGYPHLLLEIKGII